MRASERERKGEREKKREGKEREMDRECVVVGGSDVNVSF